VAIDHRIKRFLTYDRGDKIVVVDGRTRRYRGLATTAFVAADDVTASELARAHGEAMAACTDPPGGMAAVEADPAMLRELLEGSILTTACFSAPARHVVSGAIDAIDAFCARAQAPPGTLAALQRRCLGAQPSAPCSRRLNAATRSS
jgi:hypothetical protein